MRELDLDPCIGNEITSTIKVAIADAKANGDECKFEFNGVTVVVSGASDPELIYRDWSRGLSGYLGEKPTVGPYPKPQLSDAERASDAEIKSANEKRAAELQAAHDREQAAKVATLEDALCNAGPIDLIDETSWNECKEANSDPYGSCVVRYAEKWARLMQTKIATGCSVADCADETSHMADDEGITGFMYGVAVSILAKCWKHGEGLRRWHNKKTQVGTEGDAANESGGVLNPALINLRYG